MSEENAYILGTDTEELHRLGVQHQVWAEEAQKGWRNAQFKAGDTLLDLGCGPGFCTKELAYIAGQEGKVIGVDMSQHYIHHLGEIAKLHHLNIDSILANFDDLILEDNSLDGMYCRWALAWLSNPRQILDKVHRALKPGGKMVIHEYYDWTTHQTRPHLPNLHKAITAAMQSFRDGSGEINIGRELSLLFSEMGMKVTGIRLMAKVATPDDFAWQWPKTFYHSYFPRLVDMNYLSSAEVSEALKEMAELEKTDGATLCCPLMVEVIAEKQ